MNTLYEITTEQRELMNLIEESEGLLTPEIEAELAINESQLQQKSISYLEIIKKKEAYTSLIDAEIKRLQALKRQSSNTVVFLKENLLNAVKTFGAFEVGLTKFGTRKSSSVEVEDVNSLPKEFKVVTVTERADKKLLKEALQSGQEIEGVCLKQNLNLKIN